jgi:hypothetical protein
MQQAMLHAAMQPQDLTAHRTRQRPAPAVAVPAKLPQQRAADLIHQTNLTDVNLAPVAFTETFFVIVEGNDSGFSDRPVFQIQLWRLTVFHPAVDADGNKIPPKQT